MDPQPLHAELGVANLTDAYEYLSKAYVNNQVEIERQNHCALIDAQLEHNADYALDDYLVRALKDPVNRQEHRELLPWAKVNALLSRVCDELATVYAEPAERTVASGAEQFAALQKKLQLDLTMRATNRKLVAHEALWLSLRVRDDEPVLDVYTPSTFWCVTPVGDPTHLAGVLMKLPLPPKVSADDAHYVFLGRWQTITLNARCEPLTAVENPLAPNLPGVLVTLEPVNVTRRFLPLRANADVTSAETAGSFQTLIGYRESLVPQRQVYVTGDTTRTTMGQTSSSSREVFLGEGVTATSVASEVSAAPYQANADALADTAAANKGLAPATRKLASATSGYELWLRAVPLVKRRREQIDVLRDAERRLAEHMSAVIDHVGLEQYKFSADGFAIQFGEVSMPMSEQEELAVFETKRRLLLDDTIAELARRGQITEDQATEDLATHAKRETARVALLQDLSAMNASPGSTVTGDETNNNRDGGTNTAEKVTIQ